MMGSPSPVASKVRKESPSSSSSGKVRPHRRTSSVASSCVSLELGDQDGQSPGRSNGLGKSPVAVSSSSPRTPAGPEKSGSPAALKKGRASIGSPDDLARGLDFGSSSPSTEEKKHPFLTRGGGHKKVTAPATQSSSPAKKAATTPGKEKLVTGRATASFGLSPMKSVEAKKDFTSPGRSVLASESSSTNESLVSEGTTGWVAKKASPRASLDSKISALKSSPRSNTKPVASTKGRTNSNGEEAAISSPVDSLDAETKSSLGKSPDVKIRKSSSVSPLKFKAGLTSPKSNKLAKTRQGSPGIPGRVKTRIEKAEHNEDLHTPELASVAVSMENATVTMSGDDSAKKKEEGLTLLPSLMLDGNVGDDDMGSLNQGSGDPGFDNDMEMPTSWLSEDLPCMFSSLSRLPEPDDSSSSLLGDPPEVLDDPFPEDTTQVSPELPNPSHFQTATDIMMTSTVTSESPIKVSNEDDESAYNNDSSSFNLMEESGEAEDELEPRQSLLYPAVIVVPQSVPLSEKGSNFVPPVTESVVHETSLQVNENALTETQSSQVAFESRGIQPVSSQNVEVPTEAITKESSESSKLMGLAAYMSVPTAIPALREEGIQTAADDEIPAAENQYMIASSDDESSEDYNEDSCSAQLNLKQSFDAAAEPAVSRNDVDEGDCDMLSGEDTCNLASALSTNAEILPEVTQKTELEFADESQDGEERGRFTPTEVDHDMMIFDFEEHWALNAGDESSASDASQNGAEELQSCSSREVSLLIPAQDEVAKSLPANVNSYEKDTESPLHEESEEVFHLLEGSEQSSTKAETNLSSPSEPPVQHNLEPLAPIPSQSKLLSEADFSESLPSYTTSETEHSNAVNIGQVDQNVDVSNGKDEEVEVAEHQNSSVHTLLEQNSTVADLPVSKSDLLWSNTKAPVDEHASAHEALNTPSVSAVNSIGLLSENVQHFDDSTHASYQSVLFPLQDASQKSYFETPAQPEACKTDDSLVMDLKSISPPEVSASTLQSAEITNDRLVAETESQSSPNRDVTSGTGDLINSEVNSSKLLMVESDQNTLDSSAGDEVDPLESSDLETGISEEEQTEAAFLLSLETRQKSCSNLNEDSSIPDQKLQTNFSHEEPQGQADIIKADDPECLAGDEHVPQPKAELLNMSSESEEDELEASEHSDLQMLSRGMFPVEEKSVESQYQEDERTSQHGLQMESPGDMANESEVHHQLQRPLINTPETPLISTPETSWINTPETLLEDKEAQANVPTENGLPTEVHDESRDLMSVSCSPVLDKEDEILNENFDSEFKVESTASVDEADVGTDTVITTAGAAVSDTTSSAEILEKGEAICNSDEVTPVSLSVREFSSLGLNEVGDIDDKLANEDTVGEERKENASDLGEQRSSAVHGWEEPLLVNYTSDSNTSTEDPMDTLHEELVVTNPTSSAVVDDTTEVLEIHTGKPEEALRTVSTPDEKIECHDHAFQESQLPLATPLSADDQVSETEVALETEEVLMTPAFDDSDDRAVKGVETVPENITSQEPLVAVHQLTSNAAKSEVEEQENADLTGVKEGEDLSNTPESIPVLKEKDSDVDISQNMDVDESQVSPPPEMYTFDTFSPESTHSVSPGQHSAEETLLEDEETVYYSPVKILVASDTPDTTVLGDVGVETLSPVSWPAGKEAESLNGDFEEESVLENALVHSPEAKVDFGAQKNLNITDGTHTASLKDENEEESFLQEKPLLQDEKSPEEFIVVSRDDSAISDVDIMEEHSWKGGKEEESLSGSLERDEDIPFSQLKSPAEETPKSTISEVICVQNHSDDACNGESFYDALKEESMLEDEDTVVYRPAVEDFPIERTASSKDVETVMDSRVESFNALDDTELDKPSVEEVLTEGSGPEGVEKVVDSHKEMLDVPDQDTTSKASLVVGEEETLRDEKEGESLNGNTERECKLGVEERTEEPLIAPDVLNTTHKSNSNLVVADELEKQTVKEENIVEQSPEEKSTFEVKEAMVESSEEESVVAPDLQNATNISNLVVAKELEKQTGKEENTLEQSLEEESTSKAEETMVESPEKESPVAPRLQNATNTSNLGVAKELEKQTGQEETTLEQNPEEESTSEVEEAIVESSENKSVVAPDLQNAKNTSNLGVTAELEKQNGQEETTSEQSPEKRSSVKVEEKVMVANSENESLVAPDLQIATNTSNPGVAKELEKQTGQEKTTSEQSPDEESTFDVEETVAVESSEKESFFAPDLQNATYTSNLGVAKELEKQSVEEEMTLEHILEKRSSIEVEEKMMVENSEKESFFAPDLINANHTSSVEVAEKPEKQTVKEEETLDRNLETKPTTEIEEKVEEESAEEESIVAPYLHSAPNTSNLVVADELEKQTDKEDETLDPSLKETVVGNTQQACVSPDLLNEKASNIVVELEKQTDTEEETLEEEKPMLEVEERLVESSKESLVASDAATETLDAEDLDKHPTWKTSNKEGESLNGITSEEESIPDTVVVSNVKKESVSLSDNATQEPHESGDQTADIVKNTLDETVVAKTDTCAEDLDKSSKAKESCMTNGEKHDNSNVPANMQGTTAPTNTQTETTSEPQSPTATLHPLSRPPFSGSQQDRLWEEQAEAYNSGQGTPSHATKVGASGVSSSSPSEKPTPSEDQIQPVAAAAAVNGNHAVIAGPSNGPGSHENGNNNNNTLAIVQSKGNGKEKLHTPLRSLLLEDIIHRDPIITPNGVSSSPSFIRRLFRVVSTSSRGSDRVVPQAKLKRSASMWVSCLGSPQVQQ